MDYELAWAAGFFDGEGTTSYLRKGTWIGPRLSVAQNNVATLQRFQNAVGCGKIYEHTTRKGMYQWTLQRGKIVEDCLNKLWPFLSEQKKDQAIKVFALIDNNRSK